MSPNIKTLGMGISERFFKSQTLKTWEDGRTDGQIDILSGSIMFLHYFVSQMNTALLFQKHINSIHLHVEENRESGKLHKHDSI